jgi:para-aminobenzoate synthetase component I
MAVRTALSLAPSICPTDHRNPRATVPSSCSRPIRRELPGFTPDRLALTVGSWHEPALLESGPGFGDAGRWNLFTAHPRLVFEANESEWVVAGPSHERQTGRGDVLAALAAFLKRFGLADPSETPDRDDPPFQGGAIGFLGYDLAPSLERLPRHAPRDSKLPDLRFSVYDTVAVYDHIQGRAFLEAHDLLDEGPAAVEHRAQRWYDDLDKPVPTPALSQFGTLSSNFTETAYLAAARRSLEYIATGDVFQVNLSQRFTARGLVDPLDLYLRLRTTSPAPFAAFLRWDDQALVSASPESFYQTRGDWIVTRPIKGTRPRGATPDADSRLAAELAASPKDRAELTMIVDLERNDLGRVCQYGSVQVREALAVETFAQVHHLVATVEGRIRPELGPIDVVRAMFPGGSITGAPKIRAMEVIDELEPTRRSAYTGAIGFFGRNGSSAFNIAIRTLTVEGDRVSYQVGGGIVADSVPESEYHETLHKGRGLRAVIEEGLS